MAAIQIKNGQEVTSTAAETEIHLAADQPFSREIKFRVTSGAVQVTTGNRNGTGVIGGNIHAYASGEPDFMTTEPNGGDSIYIKGVGVIVFSF